MAKLPSAEEQQDDSPKLHKAAVRAAEKWRSRELPEDLSDEGWMGQLTQIIHAAIDDHLKSEVQPRIDELNMLLENATKSIRTLVDEREGWEELREAADRVQREYYEYHEPDGSGSVSQNAMEKIDYALCRVREEKP